MFATKLESRSISGQAQVTQGHNAQNQDCRVGTGVGVGVGVSEFVSDSDSGSHMLTSAWATYLPFQFVQGASPNDYDIN